MRLILIRHGESKHAKQGVIAGVSSCPGMTEHGVEQVRKLADRLRTSGELKDTKVLFSSPVLRAYETAEILVDALPVNHVERVPNLCEIRPGEADGLSYEAYRIRYGEFDLVTSPYRPIAPGGESWIMFKARVQAQLEGLAHRYKGQTVVAVTHAGFVVVSLLNLFDIRRPGSGAWLNPKHTSLTDWSYSTRWQLDLYNDVSHLTRRE